MGKKKKPKPSQPANSKLIVPGAQSGQKSQLLVPGGEGGKSSTRLAIPGVEQAAEPVQPTLNEEDAQAAEQMDHFTVINEDTGESVIEESHPVKITAMVPPPDPGAELEAEYAQSIEEESVEPVAPVAMADPAEQEAAAVGETAYSEQPETDEGIAPGQPEQAYEAPAEAYTEPAEGYTEPAEGYAEPAEGYYAAPEQAYVEQTEALEQPVQEPYYDPAQYAPAPVQPAVPMPAPPMPQAPPAYGYGPPPGYQTQGMAPGQMYPNAFAPARNVPAWALVLVGALVGFLGAMVVFKFTDMGAALRGDLIEEGRQKAAKRYQAEIKQLRDDGYGEQLDEEKGEPAGTGTGDKPEPEDEPEPGAGEEGAAGADEPDAADVDAADPDA